MSREKLPSQTGRLRRFLGISAVVASSFILQPRALIAQTNTNNVISITPQTFFHKTKETFANGESVYEIRNSANQRIGEFWPVHGLNLVTRQTDPEVFKESTEDMLKKLGGVATAPDGMTGGALGMYVMEGKSLSNGRACGDGEIKNYGIIVVKNGFDITFTHKKEHETDFDALYENVKQEKGTLFFLPSILRNGNFLSSNNVVDKVLVRRNTPSGPQIGIILFDKLLTYDEARIAIQGLDLKDSQGNYQSQTTHIYVLDGGPTWGESAKKVNTGQTNNPQTITRGSRVPGAVTNYLVVY